MSEPTPPPAPPATQTMYAADGKPVEVPVADVGARFRSGALTFAKGQTVHLTDPTTGQIVPMSGAAAGRLLGSVEGAVADAKTAADFADQEDAKAFGTVGQGAAAAGLGVARGATAGLSDAAIAKIGGEGARTYLQKQTKFNPTASALGEVAGMVAPALVTGGASAEAGVVARGGRLATAVPRGITALGETAANVAERGVVGLGGQTGGKLAGAARTLAQGATEGALYGAGQAVSDASIKGEPLEVQKIIAHSGQGALLGAALTGALHGTVSLGKSGVNKVTGAVREGVTEAATKAKDKLVDRIAGALGEDVQAGARVAEADAARAGAKAAGEEVGAAAGAAAPASDIRTQVKSFLASAEKGDVEAMMRQGDDFFLKSTAKEMGIATEGKSAQEIATAIADDASKRSVAGTSVKVQKNWDKLTEDARGLVPGMIEEDVRRVLGKEKHAIITRAEGEEGAALVKREAGEGMERVLGELDHAAKGDAAKLPSMTTAKERIEQEVIEPMLRDVRVTMPDGTVRWKDGGTRAKIAAELRAQTEAFGGTTSFRQMHKDRVFFDEGVNFQATSKADQLKSKAFRSARNVMDDELARAGDRASGGEGGATALRWQSAKNRYAAANALHENFKIGAGLDAKNRVHGLSEQFGSAKGQALGAALGATLGSVVPVAGTAVGGFVGGLAGNYLGSAAASYSRRYGAQHVAKIAREASTDGVLRGAMGEVDKLLDSKLGTYFGETAVTAAAAAKKQKDAILGKLEDAANGVVDAKATRAADAAEKAATRAEEQAQRASEALEQKIAAAPPGAVRRALTDKLVAVKDAGARRVQAARAKAAELGERAGRVAKALPSASAIATEGERIQQRAASSREEEYQRTRQQYASLGEDPSRAQRATAQVRVARPDLADKLDQKIADVAAYVNARAPVSGESLALTRSSVADRVPPSEQAKFLSIAKTARDPMSVLDDLRDGSLTSEQMQVVKDLYPDLHQQIVTTVVDKLAESDKPLPYAKRLQVGILLMAPTDASLEPDFMSSVQATFAQAPPPSPGGGTGAVKATGVSAATSRMAEMSGALDE